MNIFESDNYLNENLVDSNQINPKNISLFNLKFLHKIFNSINISLLFLIFILSFLSFNSQRKWTIIYSNIAKTRSNNNNLIDYISKTEELYIDEIESLNTLKKTTPKDLIYLEKKINNQNTNKLIKNIKYIQDGLRDSKYQRGY